MTQRVVIVGGSVGGVRVAQALRSRGFTGQVVLVEKEVEDPYDKPPLSKDVLTDDRVPDIALASIAALRELGVDYVAGASATAVDRSASVLDTSAGTWAYDHLVIATGAAARRLPEFEGIAGVTALRTKADAIVIRKAIAERRDLVVVGGGFIGAEVASSVRAAGLPVTLVEVADRLMPRVLPAQTSAAFADLHRGNGVELVLGCRPLPCAPEGRLEGVTLLDGRTVRADLVVVGVGAVPAVDWVSASLPVSDGVECDSTMRVIGTPNIWAVGDVARWWNPRVQRSIRVEHWTSAREQAVVVANNIVTDAGQTCDLLPFVWSDQHGARIQHVGFAEADVEVDEERLDTRAVVFTYYRAGALVGATGINAAARMSRIRRDLVAQAPVPQAAALTS